METDSNIKAAIEAGRALGSSNLFIQRTPEGVPYVVVHETLKPQVLVDLLKLEESRAERPREISGVAQILTEQSLVEHINRFKDLHSVLFATASGVTVVYDYHQPFGSIVPAEVLRERNTSARWCRHRAEYTPRLSREWEKWVVGSGRAMTQTEFADFLDENDLDIAGPTEQRAVPTQADLQTLGHTLKVTSEDTVEATIDRTTGNYQMVAKQNMTPTGECKIWKEFDILIPIFDGGEKVRICCKFRLQKSGGQLKFGWVVPTAARMLREEYYEMAKRVGDKAGVPVFYGSPEK